MNVPLSDSPYLPSAIPSRAEGRLANRIRRIEYGMGPSRVLMVVLK